MKKIVQALIILVIGWFLKDGYDWMKYKIFPPQDQMTKIQESINQLAGSIDGNSQAVLELTKKAIKNPNSLTQNQINDISKHLKIVINSTQELNQKSQELNNVATVIKDNEGKVAANVPYWIPQARAIRLDQKNTFSIFNKLNNTDYAYSLNGKRGRIVPGDRLEYEGITGRKCYVNFMGKNGNLYGVSFYCD